MNDVRAFRVFRIQILLDPVLIVLDQTVSCAQYDLAGTVVALQNDGLTRSVVIFKAHDDVDVGPSPGIDGLVRVTDYVYKGILSRQ